MKKCYHCTCTSFNYHLLNPQHVFVHTHNYQGDVWLTNLYCQGLHKFILHFVLTMFHLRYKFMQALATAQTGM
jgi:hypothetical protein